MLRVVITALLNGLIISWVIAIGPFCWILRDGLGPNSIDSHGLRAIARFLLTFYWGPIFLFLLVLRLVIGHFLNRSLSDTAEPENLS